MKETTLINFSKISWVKFWWQTTCGNYVSKTLPNNTVHGQTFRPHDFAGYHKDFPGETMLERASRLCIIDTWKPQLLIAFSATKHLYFEGARAEKLYEDYRGYLFSARKDKKKKKN